jgi:hypothetical protein
MGGVAIRRCDLDASTTPWPEQRQANGEALVGFDLARSNCGRGEHGLDVRTAGALIAVKEELTPSARAGRQRCLRFANETDDEAMILQILADTRNVADNSDAEAAQILGIADTRQHQQTRRLDHSGAQNRLTFGHDRMMRATMPKPDSGAAISLEHEGFDGGSGQQRQVLRFKRREKVAMDNTKAAAVLGVEIDRPCAVADRRTNIVTNRMPRFCASREESRCQRTGLRHAFDVHGPVVAALAFGASVRAGLNALKHRLEVRKIPSTTSRSGPAIEVGRVAPDPDHRVDTARPADDCSARPVDHPSGGSLLRCGAIGPIDIRSKV